MFPKKKRIGYQILALMMMVLGGDTLQEGRDYEVTPEGKRVMFRVRLTAGAGGVLPRFRNAALVGVLKEPQEEK